ncbi:MAG: hypothetical protein AAF765_12670, partial [Bacteroidota bacterium]
MRADPAGSALNFSRIPGTFCFYPIFGRIASLQPFKPILMTTTLVIAVVAGISVLLFLILKLKINAFIALLIGSIIVGLVAGLDAKAIIDT